MGFSRFPCKKGIISTSPLELKGTRMPVHVPLVVILKEFAMQPGGGRTFQSIS